MNRTSLGGILVMIRYRLPTTSAIENGPEQDTPTAPALDRQCQEQPTCLPLSAPLEIPRSLLAPSIVRLASLVGIAFPAQFSSRTIRHDGAFFGISKGQTFFFNRQQVVPPSEEGARRTLVSVPCIFLASIDI
jgi:hypothetical protein